MSKVISVLENNVMSMTSTEIADLTGKEKKNIHADIKIQLLNGLYGLKGQSEINKQKIEGIDIILDIRGYWKEVILDEYHSNILLEKYKGFNRLPHRLREESALKTIEQLLDISLIRQFKCLDYKVDGYHVESNTVYEIDESGHKYRLIEDLIRQREIEKILKCKFVRIKV